MNLLGQFTTNTTQGTFVGKSNLFTPDTLAGSVVLNCNAAALQGINVSLYVVGIDTEMVDKVPSFLLQILHLVTLQ